MTSALPAKREGFTGFAFRVAAHAALHPSTIVPIARVGWRFRRRRWLLRAPFLPVPDREYVRWRMYTAYGDENALPPVSDLVRYARWVAHQR